jgi:NhaP-type Na+/H+ or K+/H+ antiporter
LSGCTPQPNPALAVSCAQAQGSVATLAVAVHVGVHRVRGIVSLAAALAIPFTTANGQPFPFRELILFLTFAVILVTLVGQGLMLAWVIRALGLAL